MKHEKSRSEEMKGFKTEEMHGDVLRWIDRVVVTHSLIIVIVFVVD